jgi:hypothetical protein
MVASGWPQGSLRVASGCLPVGYQIASAAPPHTTHQLSPQKIHYRHHPLHGTEVEVVRVLRRDGEEVFTVKVPAGFQLALPSWMLDPIYCGSLPQEGRPRVSLAALLELEALMASQLLPCGPGTVQKAGTDAPKIKDRLLSDPPGLPQEGPVGKFSPSPASSLPRTDRAVITSGGVNARPTQEAS